MSEEKPIDEIISDGATPAAQSETPSPAAEVASDATAPPEPQSWTYAALKDERSKRQRAQERIADLEQQLAVHQPQQTPADEFWANPDVQIGRMEAVARTATLRASQAEIIAEHGRETLNEIEEAVRQAMEANHPDLPLLREAMLQSDHPVDIAARWVAQQRRTAPQQRSAPAYPSNLSSVRSVGSRRGPAWTGPTPLGDIFDMGRK
jgi:hypothetical protein